MALDQTRLAKPLKKLRKLLRKLDSNPTPEQVHDLRTSARRFEAAVQALDLTDAGIPKSVLKQLGGLRKRAGKVRDMDVLTEFAAAVHPNGAEEGHVQLLEHLGARRKKQAGKLYAAVKQVRSGLRKELDRASTRLARLVQGKQADISSDAVARAAATAVRLSAQLGEPPRLNKSNLHPYRLKVKELQNVLLMAQESSRPRFVEDLGEVKDAIGKWHDWDELVGIASKLLDHKENSLLLAELKRTAEGKYDDALSQALQLRKTYLQSSGGKGKNAAGSAVPRAPVWEAMGTLAG